MVHYNFKWLFALTGLYTFIVDKCGAHAVMTTRRKIYSIVYVTVVSLITIASLIRRVDLMEDEDDLYKFTYSCLNIIGQITIFSFACKVDLYVVLVNRMDAFDRELKKLHIVVWNTLPFLVILCHFISVPSALYATYVADRSIEKKLLDIIAGYIPVIARSLIMGTLVGLLIFLWQRCHAINLFLDELDDALLEDNIHDSITIASNKATLWSEQQATDILTNVSVLLEQLVQFTELIKDIFSAIIFMNLAVFILLFSTCVVLYVNYVSLTEMSMLELGFLLIMYTAQTLELYIMCFLLETEAKNIHITVGQLNIYYLTPKLALMKNTLLLQGLHSKVDMNLYGMIPLRPAIFFRQLDVCKTMILLFLQYYKKQTQPA